MVYALRVLYRSPAVFVLTAVIGLALSWTWWSLLVDDDGLGRKEAASWVFCLLLFHQSTRRGWALIGWDRGVRPWACWERGASILEWCLPSLSKRSLICCGPRSHWHIDNSWTVTPNPKGDSYESLNSVALCVCVSPWLIKTKQIQTR